jgi:dipeptidyl-peptidase-4
MKPFLIALCIASLPLSLCAEEVSSSIYEPVVRQIEGWTVKVDPEMLTPKHATKGQRALEALANHLQRCRYVVKGETLAELQRLPIWIEWSGRGRGLVYHPSSAWLAENGFNPAMAKHVHVPNVDHLLSRNQWGKHPYAIMHELAHAYHDQVLGWDEEEIKMLYDAARNSGGYDSVLTHNYQTAVHYGMNNHKEYFAESTEAYLGVNDFYPFVRAELKQHDPRMFALQSKIWGKF